MHIKIEVDEATLRRLIALHLNQQLGDLLVNTDDIVIEVKSKQNFRSEWEPANFRAVFQKVIT